MDSRNPWQNSQGPLPSPKRKKHRRTHSPGALDLPSLPGQNNFNSPNSLINYAQPVRTPRKVKYLFSNNISSTKSIKVFLQYYSTLYSIFGENLSLSVCVFQLLFFFLPDNLFPLLVHQSISNLVER